MHTIHQRLRSARCWCMNENTPKQREFVPEYNGFPSAHERRARLIVQLYAQAIKGLPQQTVAQAGTDVTPKDFGSTAPMHKQSEKTWLAHLAEDQRYAAMAGLGFSSGLPFLLVYSTQSAWLSEAGVPIETIGLLSELTIAYKFKFVWSPFLTNMIRRCSPPSSGAGAAGSLFRRSQSCWRWPASLSAIPRTGSRGLSSFQDGNSPRPEPAHKLLDRRDDRGDEAGMVATAADSGLPHARLPVERNVHAPVQESAHFRHRHCVARQKRAAERDPEAEYFCRRRLRGNSLERPNRASRALSA